MLAAFYPVLAAFIAMLAAFLAMLAAFSTQNFFLGSEILDSSSHAV